MDEVDEDLRNQDTKTAHEKIVESQHLLKSITGTCKKAVVKIRERVVDNEMKLGALNRKIKNEKYVIRMSEKETAPVEGTIGYVHVEDVHYDGPELEPKVFMVEENEFEAID